MTAPSTYLRELRELRSRRHLEIARLLRDNPAATNIELARALNVSRNTITEDRKAIMDSLQKQTLNETEQMRLEIADKLRELNKELELHRKDGMLPVNVVHEMMLVHRTLIELFGCRLPVTEHLEVKKTSVKFEVSTVSTSGKTTEPKTFTLVRDQLVLNGDNDAQP